MRVELAASCVLSLAGCGRLAFDPVSTDANGTTDSTGEGGTEGPVCTVDVNAGIVRGQVGGDGGFLGMTLDCGPLERIVGIALRMSDQDAVPGSRSAHALQVSCARVTVDATGAGAVGTISTLEAIGDGTNGWTPSTLTPMTRCQPGWILSGLEAHTGAANTTFIDVTMRCAQITPTGATGMTERIPVAGSLVETQGPGMVVCNDGEVVTTLGVRTGAGFDAAIVSCATPFCQ